MMKMRTTAIYIKAPHRYSQKDIMKSFATTTHIQMPYWSWHRPQSYMLTSFAMVIHTDIAYQKYSRQAATWTVSRWQCTSTLTLDIQNQATQYSETFCDGHSHPHSWRSTFRKKLGPLWQHWQTSPVKPYKPPSQLRPQLKNRLCDQNILSA